MLQQAADYGGCSQRILPSPLRPESIKGRQHRSRGGFAIYFIVHKPKGVEYRTIYQMKATIVDYPYIFDTKCFHVYETNCDHEILQGCT